MQDEPLPLCPTCSRPLTPYPNEESYRVNRSGLAGSTAPVYGRFVCRTPLCGKNGQLLEVSRKE